MTRIFLAMAFTASAQIFACNTDFFCLYSIQERPSMDADRSIMVQMNDLCKKEQLATRE
jgi:hypothetical protein